MTDIVERLENHNREALLGQTIYRDATREIEALRAERDRLREAIFEKETVAEIRAAAARKNYVTVKGESDG